MSTTMFGIMCGVTGFVAAFAICVWLGQRLYWFRSPVTLWSLNITHTDDNGHVAAGARGIGGETHIVFMDEYSRTFTIPIEEAENDPVKYKYIAG